MTAPTLRNLYASHNGKVTDKWSFYLDAYDTLLAPYRLAPIRLLEIGIQNGGSLDVWMSYFPLAERLVGCDINVKCSSLVYENPRIGLVIGNVNEDETQSRILNLCSRFDVILDDGSHQSIDIIRAFARYFPYLTEGGVYVAEDLHCSYWSAFGGGLFYPYSSVSFFKRLADITNFEHWGVSAVRAEIIRSFLEEYDCSISAAELAQIHSVEFLNSMCVIRKKSAARNALGPRIIAGTDAQVFPELLHLQGQLSSEGIHVGDPRAIGTNNFRERLIRPDESSNPWSHISPLPELERQILVDQLHSAENNAVSLLNASSENALLKKQLANALKAADTSRTAAVKIKQEVHGARDEKKIIEDALIAEIQQLRQSEAHHRLLAEALYTSTSWRISAPIRSAGRWWLRQRDRAGVLLGAIMPGGTAQRQRISGALMRRLGIRSTANPHVADPNLAYADWIQRFDVLSSIDKGLIAEHIVGNELPEISVIWLIGPTDDFALRAATESLERQLHSRWNCLFITRRSESKVEHLHAGQVTSDARITIQPELRADYLASFIDKPVVLISGAGVLAEHALYLFAVVRSDGHFNAFSDRDSLDARGRRKAPQFAPSYSPEFPAVGNIGMLQMTNELGEQLLDRAYNELDVQPVLAEAYIAGNVVPQHIPFVLLHGEVENVRHVTENDLLHLGHEIPLISLIIPTRDRLDFMEPCISSILQKTEYPRHRYEIIVVDNGSTESALLHYLDQLTRDGEIVLIRDPSKFNYSRLNNDAVNVAKGTYLLFVNNDIVVNDPSWLQRLVVHASRPGVGAVGAKLLYPDLTVQHGGVILGIQGVAAHAHHNLKDTDPGYMNLSNTTHAISAVTGACLMVERGVFKAAGGFDENLAVAFNDVLLCMSISELGYRNVYVSAPLLIHYESKTRGYDDTATKQALFRQEARYARSKHRELFKKDPYYNENLSLERAYELATPPRMEKPWHRYRRESSRKLNILMLSSTHQVGHGVAVVIDLQARHLVSEGHRVFIGGPLNPKEFTYPGCQRAYINTPQEAAVFAMQYGIDCVVMHTPPFYSTTRWLGNGTKTLAYDYGEPDPSFFPDSAARNAQLIEKAFCLDMADQLFAISAAVKDEAPHDRMGVIPLGNSHLATWKDNSIKRRLDFRTLLNWERKKIVLNVCRFHEGERYYKGIDEYCRLRDRLIDNDAEIADSFIFALAGKGSEHDISEMEARGLTVFANVSDEKLIDLYCGADIYANFSRWEGYNLGIGQALAMGLPVIASDIPAHRAFGIFTTNDTDAAILKLQEFSVRDHSVRIPQLSPWSEPLAQFSKALCDLCLEQS